MSCKAHPNRTARPREAWAYEYHRYRDHQSGYCPVEQREGPQGCGAGYWSPSSPRCSCSSSFCFLWIQARLPTTFLLWSCFYGGTIPSETPEEYRAHIEEMRADFALPDEAIAGINDQIEDKNGLDDIRVKAVFMAKVRKIGQRWRGETQKLKLPNAIHFPLLRSNSMILLPEKFIRIRSPILNRVLPKTTPVSRKSSTRTLMVDSMPVGMAP